MRKEAPSLIEGRTILARVMVVTRVMVTVRVT